MTLDDVYDEVLEIVSRLGGRVSGDNEEFLEREISNIVGDREEVVRQIGQLARVWFRSIVHEPEWIQEPQWPMFHGRPMVFLGQINLPKEAGVFHDDAAAFVFISLHTGVTETIIQVA